MSELQLRCLRPLEHPERDGVSLLAIFELDLGPVPLLGYARLQMADGTLKVSPPRMGRGVPIGPLQ